MYQSGKRMSTCIEQLPVELWISIFSYFEAHDLFKAFANLNHYFNQLIDSDYLLFRVRLGKSNQNPFEYSSKPYWPNSILNRIVSLHSLIQHKNSHIPEFLRWHCSQLIQLKSLKIKIRGREIPVVCNAIQQFNSLHYLSIECVPNQLLLETILCIPRLRICQLNFLRPITSINSYSNNISNIEILCIKLQDDTNNSIVNLLLNHMPNLKKLEINIPGNTFDNPYPFFVQPLFILPNLRNIILNWSSTLFNLNIFNYLYEIMPVLENLSLNINCYCWENDLCHNFIYHWWPIFRKKEQINIFLKSRILQLANDNNTMMNLDEFQLNLLAMNDKYNGSVKVNWTEKFDSIYRIIEVSICKFR